MDRIVESYDEFKKVHQLSFKGINFNIDVVIDGTGGVVKYQFTPLRTSDFESLVDREAIAKIIEFYLKQKTGIKYKYNSYEVSPGLVFVTSLYNIKELMIDSLFK